MLTAESQPRFKGARIFIVMGVAGCGKSSVGAGIAEKMHGSYFDGDDLHPPANIAKMSAGTPLNDNDRWPWLEKVATHSASRSGLVFTGCSALKRVYREFITQKAGEPVCFIYLQGSKEMIAKRMAERSGHFMPTMLLDSQFATLEEPSDDENHIKVDISGSRDDVVALLQNILLRSSIISV